MKKRTLRRLKRAIKNGQKTPKQAARANATQKLAAKHFTGSP